MNCDELNVDSFLTLLQKSCPTVEAVQMDPLIALGGLLCLDY